jgi:hypothetical protein
MTTEVKRKVKAFRLLVNRLDIWADWDPELLSLEMLDLRKLREIG